LNTYTIQANLFICNTHYVYCIQTRLHFDWRCVLFWLCIFIYM